MRFEIRFANGAWRLFDSSNYTTVRTFWLRRECAEAVDIANEDAKPISRRH